jgi:hypothetical protein
MDQQEPISCDTQHQERAVYLCCAEHLTLFSALISINPRLCQQGSFKKGLPETTVARKLGMFSMFSDDIGLKRKPT